MTKSQENSHFCPLKSFADLLRRNPSISLT